MRDITTILVPVDFSECSQTAFHLACILAQNFQARLVVLHVPIPPLFVTPGDLGKALQRPDGYRRELETRLRQVYPASFAGGVEYWLEEGNATMEILAAADKLFCDLIILGTHGRTGLGRLLLGSVAEQVVRQAPCPVLTVKTPLPAHPAWQGCTCVTGTSAL